MRFKKTILGSLAGVTAATALVGGGTFALWSDFATYDNSAGAEHLTLDVSPSGSHGVIGFTQTAMAPGENREFDFVVASRDGQVVPAASLTVKLEDLVGVEDGCTSTNSELAVDGDCADTSTAGEFIGEAMIAINAQPPQPAGDPCTGASGGRLSTRSLSAAQTAGAVNLLPAGEVLEPGEKVCVRMGLSMPSASTSNASQGDSATWKFRYDLTQIQTSTY